MQKATIHQNSGINIKTTPQIILLVEDNPITLKMVGVTLRAEGYEVREAPDGRTALELVRREMPDLILQDYLLPDINGVDLAHQFRMLPGGDEVPIICFSGFVSRVEEARIAGAEFTDFLIKPVEPSLLVRTIRNYLPVNDRASQKTGNGQRVLLVDDNPVQLKLLRLLFAERGYAVDTASDGLIALSKAEAQRPDIIVCDILMPTMDGFQLCYALRQHPTLSDLPLLLVSANYVDESDHAFALRIGASGYATRGDGTKNIVATAIELLRAGPAPTLSLLTPDQLAIEHHQRVILQLERQVRLHLSCVERVTIQSAILREVSIIAETLAQRGSFESALDEILAYCLDGAGLSKGALYLLENGALTLQAHYGFGHALQQAETLFGEQSLFTGVAESGDAVALTSAHDPQMESNKLLNLAAAESALLVPVQAMNKNMGVFMLLSSNRDLTEPDWLAFGSSLASQIAQTVVLSRIFYQLAESESRYRQLFAGASDGIFITDDKLRILDINQSASHMSGYDAAEVQGKTIDELTPNHLRAGLANVMVEYRHSGKMKGEFSLQTRSGEERTVYVTGSRITPDMFINIFHDITEERRAQDTILRLAHTDALTELPNRTALRARLMQAIQAAQQRQESLALLIMDLNDFRQINDILGHQNGDTLLVQVAARLKSTLWESDMVARLGGDEFAVLLPRLAEAQHIEVIVQKIKGALATPFLIAGVPLDVRASFGIALCPEHGSDPDTLLRRADMAMYTAKESQYHHAIYHDSMEHADAQQLALIAELRGAIQSNQLELYYQPKISVQTSRVIGMEALVRWPHPNRGMVFPDQFIPMAERTGLIGPLTTWVLGNALHQTHMWHKAGYEFTIAVNVSVRNLQQADILAEIHNFVNDSGVPPAALTLEITESAVMVEPERTCSILGALRTLGLRISIDDFGIGYSSLAYLKNLPADQLKIDKSFVTDYFKDKRNAAIVHSTIGLAHSLEMEVTAEGVEDKATLKELKTLGCDIAQGYFIGRPMPVSAVGAWMEKWQAKHELNHPA